MQWNTKYYKKKLFKHRNSIAQLLLSEHYHYYYLLWLEEHYLFAYFACGPQSWFSAQSFILTRFHPITIIITSKHRFSITIFSKKSVFCLANWIMKRDELEWFKMSLDKIFWKCSFVQKYWVKAQKSAIIFFVSLLTTWTKYTGARVLPNIRSWPSTKVPKKLRNYTRTFLFCFTLNFEE